MYKTSKLESARNITNKEEDKRVRKADTENKTENGYIGKDRGNGDYTEHGVVDLHRGIE